MLICSIRLTGNCFGMSCVIEGLFQRDKTKTPSGANNLYQNISQDKTTSWGLACSSWTVSFGKCTPSYTHTHTHTRENSWQLAALPAFLRSTTHMKKRKSWDPERAEVQLRLYWSDTNFYQLLGSLEPGLSLITSWGLRLVLTRYSRKWTKN